MLDLARSRQSSNALPEADIRKLRIGVSLWSFTPGTGGLQAHAEQLCRQLSHRGHDVVIITRAFSRVLTFRDYLFFNESESEQIVNDVRVRALRFSAAWWPVLWFISKCAARPALAPLGAWLYGFQASLPARRVFAGLDIIHHVGHAKELIGFAAARAARHWGVPFVVQPTCHPHVCGDSPLDLRLCSGADRLMVHTRYEAEHLRSKVMRCPIDVVGNGVEDRADGRAERFSKKHNIHGQMILYIGRKDAQKGYPLVVEAFEEVRRQRPDVVLVCMGPPLSASHKGTVAGLIDLDYVMETEKHDALAACTCLCVPSEGESFGLVYMEAVAMLGRPVVGRNVPVLRELLDEACWAFCWARRTTVAIEPP